MDSAACIGCGACVAACKNASAHLFMGAKVSQLAVLPQGQIERARRVVHMIRQADAEGFGSCSNEGECEAVCPKEIPISNIARMTREHVRAVLRGTL
jgi:succinate dehydrogenase / fumarate reductase iron-sulfur subunit